MNIKTIISASMFFLTGCLFTATEYTFYPTGYQFTDNGKVNVSVQGTWIDKHTYTSPYDIDITYHSFDNGSTLNISNARIIDTKGNTILNISNRTIIALMKTPSFTAVDGDPVFSGSTKIGSLPLEQKQYTIEIEINESNHSIRTMSFLLRPRHEDIPIDIRSIIEEL
jgi:hypothetical protein